MRLGMDILEDKSLSDWERVEGARARVLRTKRDLKMALEEYESACATLAVAQERIKRASEQPTEPANEKPTQSTGHEPDDLRAELERLRAENNKLGEEVNERTCARIAVEQELELSKARLSAAQAFEQVLRDSCEETVKQRDRLVAKLEATQKERDRAETRLASAEPARPVAKDIEIAPDNVFRCPGISSHCSECFKNRADWVVGGGLVQGDMIGGYWRCTSCKDKWLKKHIPRPIHPECPRAHASDLGGCQNCVALFKEQEPRPILNGSKWCYSRDGAMVTVTENNAHFINAPGISIVAHDALGYVGYWSERAFREQCKWTSDPVVTPIR